MTAPNFTWLHLSDHHTALDACVEPKNFVAGYIFAFL